LEARAAAYIAMFSSIWGASEVVLGSWLKSLAVPFSGEAMTVVAVLVMVVSRRFLDQRGSQATIGFVTGLIKVFGSFGAARIGPFIAIFMEGLLFDTVASLLKKFSLRNMAIAGVMPFTWTFLHPFVVNPLVFGTDILKVYQRILETAAQALGLPTSLGLGLLAAMYLVDFFLGAFSGLVGYRMSSGIGRAVGQ